MFTCSRWTAPLTLKLKPQDTIKGTERSAFESLRHSPNGFPRCTRLLRHRLTRSTRSRAAEDLRSSGVPARPPAPLSSVSQAGNKKSVPTTGRFTPPPSKRLW
ncbi:hypothetical protein SRHO_G00151930 [Serrasalmus rhombeus]